MRRDYDKFLARDTAVLVVGPEDAAAFRRYFAANDLPFPGLPDPRHTVLKRYGQEIKLFKLGRMPAQVLVDRQGVVRYAHYGGSMSDIPPNEEILALIDGLKEDGTPIDAD